METMVSHSKEECTMSIHKVHELLLKLEAAGLNDKLAQRVIDSLGNDLAAKVERLIELEPSTSQKRAREIMDENFFGSYTAVSVESDAIHFNSTKGL